MYSHYLIQEIVKQADCWLLHFYVGDSARNEEMCAILISYHPKQTGIGYCVGQGTEKVVFSFPVYVPGYLKLFG